MVAGALSVAACGAALPIAANVLSVAASYKTLVEDFGNGVISACRDYAAARATGLAHIAVTDSPTIRNLVAYGDSVCDQPLPKGPIGTAVWVADIASGIVRSTTVSHV